MLNAFALLEKFSFFDENGANYLIQLSKWDGFGAHLRVLRLQLAPGIPSFMPSLQVYGRVAARKKNVVR